MSARFTIGRNKVTRLPVNIKNVNVSTKHDFVCPQCNEQLTCVLNVLTTTRHFKHRKVDCKATFETLLHLTAKEILAQHSRIKLPSGIYFDYNEALPEKSWDKYRPDLTLNNDGKSLYVEIVVSNLISWEKELRFNEKMQECLIIDLSDYDREFDIEQLRYDVLESIEFKQMLYKDNRHTSSSSNDDNALAVLGLVGVGIGGYLLYRHFNPTPKRRRKHSS